MSDRPTDEHGAGGTVPESELTPEQEQEVRRLLGDARELEPMPDSVVARLDRVLAELSASPANAAATPPADHPADLPAGGTTPPDTTAQVTSLAAVRRQRAGRLLLAAAAVVVVGIGVGKVLDVGAGTSSGDSSATSAESQADTGGQDRALTAPEAAGSVAEAPAFALDEPVRVDPERFSADVERARRLAEGTPKGQQGRDTTGGDGVFATECSAADWGRGTFVPVRYAGDAGVLVFRAPTGDSQVVDLFQCGSAKVLRSITLPAP